MTIEIRVPELGESITEAIVAQWLKSVGDAVEIDEAIIELETDKVAVEVPSPVAGVLTEILAEPDETVEVNGLLGVIDENATAAPSKSAPKAEPEVKPEVKPEAKASPKSKAPLSPAVRRLVDERGIDPAALTGTGKDGRITKGDVLAAGERPRTAAAKPVSRTRPDDQREERVPMSRLRRTIATRLKSAQDTAVMLTTFNEVDLTNVVALRREYRDVFEQKHGVRLGYMSFFAKACVMALQEIPEVNAEIDGEDIVYKNYYNIGIAVGARSGLVVPVIKDADLKSFAEIEREVGDYGTRARDGKLKLDELQGGTFTISNGGVYGSLLSTPILNSPQSAVLGMHKIQERPVAVDGEVVIRSMMYLALTYDHRLIDGREAVTFLVRIKECLEDPQRLLLDL